MRTYPIFHKRNIPAYLAVMLAWVVISILSALSLQLFAEPVTFWKATIWAALTTMAGMSIMFVASVINLRKLAPGFRRLAEGNPNPEIPPVWCPVLTAAINAAVELAGNQAQKHRKE